MKRFRGAALLLLGVGLIVLAGGLIAGQHRSAVDWRRARVVGLGSDDWGLAGFLPDSAAIADLDREALAPGSIIDVYWHSTFEDSATIVAVGCVLAAHRGRDGLPAVLQPNYILASLAYRPETTTGPAAWTELELPAVPPGYERPGLWTAVADLQAAGVWHPELHGRWHYDPDVRRQRTSTSAAAQAAAARQILPFPGSERAWELGPWRDPEILAAELDRSIEQFRGLFGYPPRSIIAPDYRWRDDHEALWVSRGLRVIQGQKQQQQAGWTTPSGRARKFAHRVATRWSRPDRVYLDRNCLFEPVQLPPGTDGVRAAHAAVRAAWRRGEPAVLQIHRINLVHLDAQVRRRGLAAFARLLTAVTADDPIYLVDGEIADLKRRGTSWAVRGGGVVLRNQTRSRRLVVVPPQALAAAAARTGRADAPRAPLILSLAPGEVRLLDCAAAK